MGEISHIVKPKKSPDEDITCRLILKTESKSLELKIKNRLVEEIEYKAILNEIKERAYKN